MDPVRANLDKVNFTCLTTPGEPCPRFANFAPGDDEVRFTVAESLATGRVVEPEAVRLHDGRNRCLGAAMALHAWMGQRSPYQDAPVQSQPGREGLSGVAHQPCPADVALQMGVPTGGTE